TSTALVQDCFSQITEHNSHLNAFIKVQNESAVLEKAKEADDRFIKVFKAIIVWIIYEYTCNISISGIIKGPLDGIPITYKDNFCTKELPTTCGSKMLKNLLQDAGAIMIGKTNMDEFGMGAFGPVYNPIDQERRVAGGSSGGSAAAVASGISLGSDTGGSIRLPASYCGVIGFKPSYGQCSRWGLVAYASSLDTVVILIPSFLDIISKYDEKDPSSLPPKLRSINASLASFNKTNYTNLSELRVGIPQEYYVSELSDPIKNLWKQGISLLRSHGATIVSVSCPSTKYALPAYYILAPAEASSNLARYDGFGEEVKRRILLGTYTLTAGPNPLHLVKNGLSLYNRNNDEILEISDQLRKKNNGVDVIMTPVAISTSPKTKDSSFLSNSSSCTSTDDTRNLDGDNSFVNAYVNDVFTIPANLA
ncbi:16664_t:CDS:2, partial [Racocetra fulgida]